MTAHRPPDERRLEVEGVGAGSTSVAALARYEAWQDSVRDAERGVAAPVPIDGVEPCGFTAWVLHEAGYDPTSAQFAAMHPTVSPDHQLVVLPWGLRMWALPSSDPTR